MEGYQPPKVPWRKKRFGEFVADALELVFGWPERKVNQACDWFDNLKPEKRFTIGAIFVFGVHLAVIALMILGR